MSIGQGFSAITMGVRNRRQSIILLLSTFGSGAVALVVLLCPADALVSTACLMLALAEPFLFFALLAVCRMGAVVSALLFRAYFVVLLGLDHPAFAVSLVGLCIAFIIFRAEKIERKATLRHLLIGATGMGVCGSTALFAVLLRDAAVVRADSIFILQVMSLSTVYLLFSAVSVWGIARIGAASNPWFFTRVLRGESLEDPLPLIASPTPEVYVLNALLRPSHSISRIREHVEPSIGSFEVTSEIEFEIPEKISSSGDVLYFPVVLQGKCELTRDLRVSTPTGGELRRLNDGELLDLLFNAFQEIFSKSRWRKLDEEPLKRLIAEALGYNLYESDDRFYLRSERLLKSTGVGNEKQAELLALFIESTRYVKPICYRLSCISKDHDALSHVTLVINRTVPLVPVRRHPSGRASKVIARVKRLFTKKRLHFYFGLGNADCARSYHLSFSGPPDTYLCDLRIARVGGDDEFFICENIRVSSRYDQKQSRVFIRRGRGFSNAALSIQYEKRGYKPLAALSACSMACLMVALYVYFIALPEGSPNVIAPLSVLSIGTLITVWQAMEDYRVEEWLWICILALAASSFWEVASMIGSEFLEAMMGPLWGYAWLACILVGYLTTLSSSLMLFMKIKLHGAIMDRVPRLRTVMELDSDREHLEEIKGHIDEMKRQLDEEDERWRRRADSGREPLGSAAEQDDSACARSSGIALTRGKRYEADIRAYTCLTSIEWIDGWLMPVWTSSMNLFRLPSRSFYDLAEKIIHSQTNNKD